MDALAPEETSEDHDDDDDTSTETASVIITSDGRPPSAILGTRVNNYETYRRKLDPLFELEERLMRLISSPDEDEATHLGPSYKWEHYAKLLRPNENMPPPMNINGRPAPTIQIPHKAQTSSSAGIRSAGAGPSIASRKNEVVVHTSTNWKKMFVLDNKSKSPKSPLSGEIEGWWEDPDDPVHTLNACAPTMQELWRDPQVKKRLQEKRIRVEELGGLYVCPKLFFGCLAHSFHFFQLP